jgi:uncharacterized protein
MTDATTSPRAVLERAHRTLAEHDVDGFADLFAADGVLESPFARPGAPRQVAGRETIRAQMRARGEAAHASGVRLLGFEYQAVHETADPEVIVAEFREELVFGDQRRWLPFIQVLRVRDGEIVTFRDYVDNLGVADATSALPDLRAALMGPPSHEIENRSAAR